MKNLLRFWKKHDKTKLHLALLELLLSCSALKRRKVEVCRGCSFANLAMWCGFGFFFNVFPFSVAYQIL